MRCYRWLSFVVFRAMLCMLVMCASANATSYHWKITSSSAAPSVVGQYCSSGTACGRIAFNAFYAAVSHGDSSNPACTYSISYINVVYSGTTGAPTAAGQSGGVSIESTQHTTYSCAGATDAAYSIGNVGFVAEAYDDCSTLAPAGEYRVLSTSSLDQWVAGEEACDANMCGWTLDHLYTTFSIVPSGSNADQLWQTTATGSACHASQAAATTTPTSGTGDTCFDLNGVNVCVDNSAQEEPTINDTEQPDVGMCASTSDGGQICKINTGQSPTTPPVPNNGSSSSTPAAPNVSITNNASNTTTNYYNSTTVNNQASGGSSSSGSSSGGDGGSTGGAGTGSGCTGSGCTSSGTGGDWYTKKTDTFGSVLGGFMASVQGSAVFTQATGFFTLSLGGSCPVWSTSVPVYGAIVIDQQCSSAMQGIWPYIYAVVVATAAFYAFRIAFL